MASGLCHLPVRVWQVCKIWINMDSPMMDPFFPKSYVYSMLYIIYVIFKILYIYIYIYIYIHIYIYIYIYIYNYVEYFHYHSYIYIIYWYFTPTSARYDCPYRGTRIAPKAPPDSFFWASSWVVWHQFPEQNKSRCVWKWDLLVYLQKSGNVMQCWF